VEEKGMSPDKAAELCGAMNAESNWHTNDPWNDIDIAHANGKVQIETYRLWNRVIWAKHEMFRPQMEYLVWRHVLDSFAHEKPYWIAERKGFFMDMVRIATNEIADPALCKTCNGNKQVVITESGAKRMNSPSMAGKIIVCEVCNGTGFKKRGNRYLACQLALSEAGFRQTWRDRYNRILECVRGLDGAAKSALAHRLGA